MPIIKIIPMPGPKGDTGATGPAGEGGGISSVEPLNLDDQNGDLLLRISKTGTGTTRIETPQDDLSLRSARDITLYAGSDGPGKVYIGWGDAVYTPNSSNQVATFGDVDEIVANAVGNSSGLGIVKYVEWQYPTEGAIAIQNNTDGEAISLKSSNSAALRWHIRNGGHSVAGWSIPTPSIIQQNGVDGVGPYYVKFAIEEQDFIPPTGYHYTVNFQGPWAGSYPCTESTTTSITLEYPGPDLPGPNEGFTGGTITPPSVYTQVEARNDGVWIKNANWSENPTYSNSWQFTNDGSIHFPYGQSNQRTGYGDVLRFANSFDQSIIMGPKTTESSTTANRLVIAGADGYPDSYGEGGDLYLWAGTGGSAGGTGGDIKVDAGNGQAAGEGGTVKVRGGYSPDGVGGFVEITAGGSSNNSGGHVDIKSGYSGTGSGGNVNISSQSGGNVNITASNDMTITATNGNMQFFMDGGMFIGPVDSSNQILKRSDLPTGATGSFTSADGKTITVSNGIITGIE